MICIVLIVGEGFLFFVIVVVLDDLLIYVLDYLYL